DLDGTITSRNVFLEFIRYAAGTGRFAAGLLLLSPLIVLHWMGVISSRRIKEIVLGHFFRGTAEARLAVLAEGFRRERLPGMLRASAMERIRWHQAQGDRVAIVSACVEDWVRGWCRELGVALVATRVEVRDGALTGRLLGENCHGEEKVRRIREALDLSAFEYIFAYGDSPGDRPMLALAHEGYYAPFG
ncbi:MAG TPA: HAD-IB family hydrolase, partial [Myxococcales bacterium]|nr:HAD-IB family hydrolase [Myxococcales bacterium]